jgi:hypothetical protein
MAARVGEICPLSSHLMMHTHTSKEDLKAVEFSIELN